MMRSSLRTVIIATPSGTGRVCASYAYSLVETVRAAAAFGIVVRPLFVAHDALVQRARNDLLLMCRETGFDVVWIDDDMEWSPDDFMKLIGCGVDVVGAAVRKKTDERDEYNIVPAEGKTVSDHLLEVLSVGTGMLFMSGVAIDALWRSGAPYLENRRQKRWAFETLVANGLLMSEDVAACARLREAGFSIHIRTDVNPRHWGTKAWRGDIAAALPSEFWPEAEVITDAA